MPSNAFRFRAARKETEVRQIVMDGTCNDPRDFPSHQWYNRRPRVKSILCTLLIVVVGLFACTAMGQQVTMGEEHIVYASPVCTTKDSAIAVAKADAKGGGDAARELIKATKDCGIGTVVAQVIRIVFSTPTPRDTTDLVLEVKVQMQDDSWQTFYVLTDVPVKLAGLST